MRRSNLYSEVTKFTPQKSLLVAKPKSGGRNHHGVITQHHIGGGNKQRYRIIDFRRNRLDENAKVVGIEYDPNRSSNIALLEYPDGERTYILAPLGVVDGRWSSPAPAPSSPSQATPCRSRTFPPSLRSQRRTGAGKGGQLCRSAGMYARLTNKEGGWATLVFPSGEIRQVLGQLPGDDRPGRQHRPPARAAGQGRQSRHLGIRPTTRGMAQTHDKHPMGGGSGRSKGNRPPASRTGVLAKGGKTRKPDKAFEQADHSPALLQALRPVGGVRICRGRSESDMPRRIRGSSGNEIWLVR